MKYTVREYKAILNACKTPKTRAQIANITGFNHSGIYDHLYRMSPRLMVTYKEITNNGLVSLFLAKLEITDDDIVENYKQKNKYRWAADISFDEPVKARALTLEEKRAKVMATVEEKKKLKRTYAGNTHKGTEPGGTIYKGGDVHIKIDKRPSKKVYVGSTLNGF